MMRMQIVGWCVLATLLFAVAAVAAEPWEPIERRLPPSGIEIAAQDREQLGDSLARVQERFDELVAGLPDERQALVPDVEIYLKAVRFALDESEFFRPQDVAAASSLLETANRRIDELAAGQPRWPAARGLVVAGYRSAVDGSVQPYGLVIPEKLDLDHPVPLYV